MEIFWGFSESSKWEGVICGSLHTSILLFHNTFFNMTKRRKMLSVVKEFITDLYSAHHYACLLKILNKSNEQKSLKTLTTFIPFWMTQKKRMNFLLRIKNTRNSQSPCILITLYYISYVCFVRTSLIWPISQKDKFSLPLVLFWTSLNS